MSWSYDDPDHGALAAKYPEANVTTTAMPDRRASCHSRNIPETAITVTASPDRRDLCHSKIFQSLGLK